MTLAVVAAVSDPGSPGRANEDAWGTAGPFAWVIDGATGLGDERLLPGPSDAAWLAAALGAALADAAAAAPDPAALLHAAAVAVEARFVAERRRGPREQYEMPTAAVLVCRADGDELDIAELGDCAALVRAAGHVARPGGTPAGRATERGAAARLGAIGRTPEVMAYLRSVRNQANAPGGYAVFAPDAGCAVRARRHRIAGADAALLMTDGYLAAAADYGLYDAAALFDAAAADIGAPLARLRAVEMDDPDCRRFPRFKPSDDATAVFLEVGG